MLGDPAAGGELADDGLVEFPAGGIVDGFDAGLRQLELGVLEGAGQTLVLPRQPQPATVLSWHRQDFLWFMSPHRPVAGVRPAP